MCLLVASRSCSRVNRVPEVPYTILIMIALSHLIFAISAVTGVFAAPTVGPEAPDFILGPNNLARRQDYNQNYKTGGSVNFSPSSKGYSVSFSGAGDFVVGKGWKTGTTR
jgi:endo-1,4-beta-xylanase